jgi:hypothetical protein
VNAGGPYSGNEGSAIQLNGSASDEDSFTSSWSYTAGPDVDAGATCTFGSPSSPTTTFTCTDDGHFTVTLTAKDSANGSSSSSSIVTVANVAPVVTVTSPLNGAILSRSIPVNASANYTDAGKNDSHTCQINWGDGTTTAGAITETAGSGSGKCTGTHSYSASPAGGYTIRITVTDDDLGSGSGQASITLR